MSNFKRWVILILFILIMIDLWYIRIYFWSGRDFAVTVRVFLSVLLYHVAVRVIWGFIVGRVPLERFHPEKKLYQSRSYEKALFEKAKVRNWKDRLPVAHPKLWDIDSCDMRDIVKAGCQAEMDHFGNIVLSLITLFFAFDLRSFSMLLFTALGACAFDLAFVMIQRYNRPRFLRFEERLKRSASGEEK